MRHNLRQKLFFIIIVLFAAFSSSSSATSSTLENECDIKPCINACCDSHLKITSSTGNCTTEVINQLWWEIGLEHEEKEKIEVFEHFHWILNRPTCKSKHFLDQELNDFDKWYLAKNGSIFVPDDNVFLEYDQHCVAVDNETQTLLVLKCAETDPVEGRYQMLGIGMLLSVPFLLATFIVYAVIPELRNVHGMSLMSYVGGLTVGYTFLAIVQISGSREECQNLEFRGDCHNPHFCTFAGYTIYFSFMLSFFWLNTMCFDIFWTFRGMRGSTNATKNFLYYCIYAWGMASFLTILVLSIDLSGASDKYKPGIYYSHQCFLQNSPLPEFLYLYMILLILICTNITFFGMTAYRIRKVQNETSAVVDSSTSGRHSSQNFHKYRYSLYLRLFIIMGVTWSMELVSWVVDENSPWFYFTDLVNCLQGLLIFLLVVCNDKVRKHVVKSYYTYKGTRRPTTMGTTFSDTQNSQLSSAYHPQGNNFQMEQRKNLLNQDEKNMNK